MNRDAMPVLNVPYSGRNGPYYGMTLEKLLTVNRDAACDIIANLFERAMADENVPSLPLPNWDVDPPADCNPTANSGNRGGSGPVFNHDNVTYEASVDAECLPLPPPW